MITVRMMQYWNDHHQREVRKHFRNLKKLEGWIFGQMCVDYSSGIMFSDGTFAAGQTLHKDGLGMAGCETEEQPQHFGLQQMRQEEMWVYHLVSYDV